MKRILLAAATVGILVTPSTASAAPVQFNNDLTDLFSIKIGIPEKQNILLTPKPEEKKPEKPVEPPKPVPAVYVVIEGDNLTKIGTAHNVEWQRLWAKNTQLTHPDVLKVGDQITIPLADEQLSREVPAAVALPTITPGVVKPAQAGATASYGGGNTYDYGYCTWYVKNRRGASLPNSLGNANTWYSRAWGMGMGVGSVPRAGAVGTTTRGEFGHVVYVESVNADGSINISEMNAPTWGAVTYRTASAGEFSYIY
jgi:surface antigen